MPKLTYICDHGETYHTCHPEIPVRLFLRFCLFSAHLRTWICHLSCRYLALDAQFAFHNLNLGKCDLRIFQEDGFVQDPMNQREQALQPKKKVCYPYLDKGNSCCFGHDLVEVSGRFAENDISQWITSPALYQGKITTKGHFHDIFDIVKCPDLTVIGGCKLPEALRFP